MRKVILSTLLILMLSASFGVTYIDKAAHVLGGYVINDYLQDGLGMSEEDAHSIGMILYVGKEAFDYASYGGFDLLDIAAGMMGADANRKVNANR